MSEMADFFVEENHIPECDETHFSPSGRYEILIEVYRTREGCWNYSQAYIYRHEVLDNCPVRTMIALVQRNYPHFPFAWVEDHPDGYDYILCSGDYQSYGFFRLNPPPGAETRPAWLGGLYTPPEAERGHGFCWIEITPSPDKLALAVLGCVWGSPPEMRFYDFSDPTVHPYPLLGGFDIYSDVLDEGWEDATTYFIQEVDIWHPDFDDDEDDTRKCPQCIRRWRVGGPDLDNEPLPPERWLGDPDEEMTPEEAARILSSGPSSAELIREDRD